MVGEKLLEVEQHALVLDGVHGMGVTMLRLYVEHAAGIVLVCRRTEPVHMTRVLLAKVTDARSSTSPLKRLSIVVVRVAQPEVELRETIYLVQCARRFSQSTWSMLPQDVVTLVMKLLWSARANTDVAEAVVHTESVQRLADEFGCVLVPCMIRPGYNALEGHNIEGGQNMHLEFLARQIARE
jgi:hypothetical protein